MMLFGLLLASNIVTAQPERSGERILVVGGGGARGAWGAGYAKYLDSTLRKANHRFPGYKNVYGTSTGSLMAPLIVLGDFDKLKTVYTTISQKTIFSVNPFKSDGSIRKFKSAVRALKGKKTIGETYNLLNYMLDTTHGRPGLSQTEYSHIRASGRYTVAVTNMRNGTLEYHCSDDNSRESMINWMWASANEPLFMTYYEVENAEGETDAYVDGGVISNVPVIEALNYADENEINNIDVIVNKPFEGAIGDTVFEKRGLMDGLLRLINIFGLQIRNNNIEIAQLKEQILECDTSTHTESAEFRANPSKYININVHYFPPKYYFGQYEINQKELVFDQGRMNELWSEGEHGVQDRNPRIQSIHFRKSGVKKIYNDYRTYNKNIRFK